MNPQGTAPFPSQKTPPSRDSPSRIRKRARKKYPGFSQVSFSELTIAQRQDWTPKDILERLGDTEIYRTALAGQSR
jgi:hypothetical protein